MAKAKARSRRKPAKRPRARPRVSAAERRSHRRIGWLAWLAVGVLAAAGAFWIAKEQATGDGEAVAPPASGLPNTPDYHSLLVDRADARHLFLGTHVGLYESRNGGRSWKFSGLGGNDAMNLARSSAEVVWVAGHNVLAKSSDGGETWENARPDGLPSLDVHGFAVDPRAPTHLYAAVAGEGLYRSTDGGSSFDRVSKDVGGGVFGLTVTRKGEIFAADPGRGLMVSVDGGRTWSVSLAKSIAGVAVNPDRPETLIATGPGIFLSRDGGRRWKLTASIQKGAGPVAWSPSDPSVAYAVGFDRVLYRTGDAGESWRPGG